MGPAHADVCRWHQHEQYSCRLPAQRTLFVHCTADSLATYAQQQPYPPKNSGVLCRTNHFDWTVCYSAHFAGKIRWINLGDISTCTRQTKLSGWRVYFVCHVCGALPSVLRDSGLHSVEPIYQLCTNPTVQNSMNHLGPCQQSATHGPPNCSQGLQGVFAGFAGFFFAGFAGFF